MADASNKIIYNIDAETRNHCKKISKRSECFAQNRTENNKPSQSRDESLDKFIPLLSQSVVLSSLRSEIVVITRTLFAYFATLWRYMKDKSPGVSCVTSASNLRTTCIA